MAEPAGGVAPRRLWRLMAAGVVAVVAIAPACADDDTVDRQSEADAGEEMALELPGPFNEHGTAEIDDGGDLLGITLDDYYFAPTYVEILPAVLGDELKVTLVNDGDEQHTFTVDDLGIDEVLDPGEQRTIQMTVENVVPAVYHCRYHADRGMRGALSYQGGGS